MEIKNLIKKTLHGTYACFTAMTAVYILIVIFLNTNSKEILVEGTRVLLFLVASFLFSLANTLFGVKAIHRAAAYLIHYALYALAVYSCLLLPRFKIFRSYRGPQCDIRGGHGNQSTPRCKI